MGNIHIPAPADVRNRPSRYNAATYQTTSDDFADGPRWTASFVGLVPWGSFAMEVSAEIANALAEESVAIEVRHGTDGANAFFNTDEKMPEDDAFRAVSCKLTFAPETADVDINFYLRRIGGGTAKMRRMSVNIERTDTP